MNQRIFNMKSNALVPELYVSNYNSSINFYTKILGFKIAYQRKEEGVCISLPWKGSNYD